MSGNYPAITETSLFKFARAIRDLFEGRSNAMGQFTCQTGSATTVVNAPNCGPESRILLSARHINAAAEVGNGTIFISNVTVGAFTVTHANSGTTNRIFDYAIQG